MTNPVDRAHAVLLRVSEFLKSLPADQLDDLIAGTAKLQVVSKGARPAARATAKPPAVSVSPDQIREELTTKSDTAGATQYIDSLKLTVPQLRALAKELDITLPSKATKPEVVRQIVQWTVGRRLASETISRPAPARF